MNEYNEFDDVEESEHLDPNIRAELRKSKERAKEAAEAKAELDNLKRELAFTKAGIPENGTGALLRKAYDGENDPEAIRKAAEEYGIIGQPGVASAPDPVQQELERHRNIAGATGTVNSGPTNEQELLAALQGATSTEEVMSVINKIGGESGLFSPGMR